MNFRINQFLERPEGRKSWYELSDEQRKKIRKLNEESILYTNFIRQKQITATLESQNDSNIEKCRVTTTPPGIANEQEQLNTVGDSDFFNNSRDHHIIISNKTEAIVSDALNVAINLSNNNVEDTNINIDPTKNIDNHLITQLNNVIEDHDYQHLSTTEESFLRDLAQCLVENNINQFQSKALLAVLRTHPKLNFVPKDPRSLIKTPRVKVNVKDVSPGQYLHIGIKSTVTSLLVHVPSQLIPEKLLIDFSTDGAELFNTTQMWPIQIRVANLNNSKPELAGIYVGPTKPQNFEEFFFEFVEESKQIILNGGIKYSNKLIPIEFRCCIADSPARSYILNHTSHVGKKPCSKCEVEGFTFKKSTRYRGIDHKLRTDEQYRNLSDESHHKGPSVIRGIPMDLVKQVPFDYMHLICLVVMKKVVEASVFGKCEPRKLESFKVEFLSRRLITLQHYCPREFARIPRELEKYSKYKATEFRQLLLYTYIVVSKGIIPNVHYNHFLLIHGAMRVLLKDTSPPEDVEFADNAIKTFVSESENIFGLQFLTYNIHGSLHLVSDYKLYGSLDSISAFTYENRMPFYRSYVRKPDQILQQIYKRTQEQLKFQNNVDSHKSMSFKAYEIHHQGPIIESLEKNSIQYENLQSPNFFYSIYDSDNTIITKANRIGIIKNIIFYKNQYFFTVNFFKELRSFYTIVNQPSMRFGVFLCTKLDKTTTVITYNEIKAKCYRMPCWVQKPMINKDTSDNQINNAYVCITM
ncbi:uncharacterized protein LOC130668312 [Microplitis mediator]|uniref:uncharacterized protein LOC130668312 n=1 Tax=Microplitis mediator TaxID=375433 RepID=UPI00255533DF|nr:uncharacterized protein LOC130668312 [Microplitis mediator]